ncbi:MAG: AsmA-like C-terminal domain-containing protein [Aliarcobacter sp.]|nr:AsmA-like C-terminal domain-containing protein [Aliarcobacter sp.]
MDKKLILEIKNIEYKSKKSASENTLEDLKKNLSMLPNILKMFQSINIERLKIEDNEFTIVLNNEDLYLDNKFINISSKLDISSNQVVLNLHSIYFKELELVLDGKLKIDYFKEKMNYFGTAYYGDIQSNINLEMDKKLAKFYLNSEVFENLKFLKKFINLPPIAEEWMYDNVEGEFKLKEFYGEFDLEKNQIIEESLVGKAQINSAKIRFHKDVDIIETKSLDVSFKNNKLQLDLIEPIFKGKKLDGSYVAIHNIASSQEGEVEVNIKAESKLDKDILDILKAYKINLPLLQKSGNTQAELLLIFPYSSNKTIITKGTFLISDAEIFIKDFVFSSKSAEVILDGSIVEVKNADFKHKNMIDAIVNLSIDTKTLKSQGTADIKSFLIGENDEKIVHIQNKKTPITLDFNKETNIELKELATKIRISDLVYVDITSLSKIYPYSKLLKDISIKDGNILLSIKDDKNISFDAKIKGLEFPIQKNGKSIEELDIKGLIQDKNISISSNDENIRVEIKDELKIYLKNLDIVINNQTKNQKITKEMKVLLANCKLRINDEIYEIKQGNVLLKKEQINFDAIVSNLDIPLKKDNKFVKILDLSGIYTKEETIINTRNKDLTLKLKENNTSLNIDGYDIFYTSSDEEEINEEKKNNSNLNIQGRNSNIIINDKYKILTDKFEIMLTQDSKYINIKHKKTDITIKESKEKKIDIFSSDVSDEFVNTVFNKEIFQGGNILFLANGDMNNLNGKIIIENSNIKDLAVLNNLLIFIHTSPALINPLLALPTVVGMATNSGFNLAAYKIVNGAIEFYYSKEKELIDVKKLLTVGNGIDFDGKGKIDLKNMSIDSDIKLIFLKDYSKIVGMIPVVNYVLLGDNNRVETQVNLFGDLDNPKISTNLTKDAFSVPMNIAKRILTSPSALFDFITGKKSEEDKQSDENMINKPLE